MKILFVGASGYGNLGDDAYKQLFTQGLLGHEILFDSPYPDIRAVDWADVVIVGGGGLIYVNETSHFQYMSTYLKRAIKTNKKIIFSSIGVQFIPQDENRLAEVLNPWKKFLDVAKVITVRCPKDKEHLQKVTTNKNIHYYPDLCYLIKPVDYHLTLPDAHIYIVTGSSLWEKEIQKHFQESVRQKKNIYGLVMSAGDIKPTKELFAPINHHGDRYLERDNLNPNEAARIIKDAEKVVTARYHGLIFSRAVGQKNVISVDKRYKSVSEVVPRNIEDAIGHINQIKGAL